MDIERLVVENLEWLRSKAMCLCGNGFDAEDLTNETILKILSNRIRFNRLKDFRPWALVIMRNIYINGYNRQQRAPLTGISDDFRYASANESDQRVSVMYILHTIRQCARRSVAIACVVLYAKGYEYAEIANMLGVPVGTVMSRISNGRKLLREAIGRI